MDYESILGQVVQSARDYRLHDKRRVDAALHGGKYLLQAKELVQHGDFAALLERAELQPRTAQRWMQLARYAVALTENGINPADEVRDMGGVKAACDLIGKARRSLERMEYGDLDDCPTCHPGSTAWNLPDGRCRSHLNADEFETERRGVLSYL